MTNSSNFEAPHPGTKHMPRWTTGELIDAPRYTWRNWLAMIGPGLVMGAAAIGGGEWLAGPRVTARYGGELMWLATISILCQVLYNIEISRYTLYSGEPIFTGKFRLMPGPWIWIPIYLLLDMGSVFPYLAANAAGLVQAVYLGHLPDPDNVPAHWWANKIIACFIFFGAMMPLVVGGKVYNSLKVVMSVKLVLVLGFLLFLGIFYTRAATWWEITSGFVKFGNVPVQKDEDTNGNGTLDPGEDWDSDGHLDVAEKSLPKTVDTDGDGKPDDWAKDDKGNKVKFEDIDGDGIQDGDNVENALYSLFKHGRLPDIDYSLISFIAVLAAIAGNGGLTNTPISNFTRDQGWGMGHHVGAIPSMIGGHGIELSHVGCVFEVNQESLPRWKRWVRHLMRDQICVWMIACFIGVAMPSILSVEFLRRGTQVGNDWSTAAMTSGGVESHVSQPRPEILASKMGLASLMNGDRVGRVFWAATLLIGFLVLMTSLVSTIDGAIRRWVDAFWTASARLREHDVSYIRYVYFYVLLGYATIGFCMLWMSKPDFILKLSTGVIYNIAFGFSAWHTLIINTQLLPRELRPGWFPRIGLVLAGVFFWTIGTVAALSLLGYL